MRAAAEPKILFNQVDIALPMPPSVNGAFGTNFKTKRRFKSESYEAWIAKAKEAVFGMKRPSIDIPVMVKYEFGKPDYRRRDVSNYIKCTEDFLVSAGFILDDSLVDHLTAYWTDEHRGIVHVQIKPMMRIAA